MKTKPKTKLQPIIIKEDGIFCIQHYRKGKLLSETKIHNTATAVGKAVVAGLINEASSGGFKWIALDSSSTTATTTDTALATEITANGCARASASCTRTTTDDTNDTAQLLHTWTASGTQSVRGAGIFDTSTQSGGTLLDRATFAVKSMESTDTLAITYKVDID